MKIRSLIPLFFSFYLSAAQVDVLQKPLTQPIIPAQGVIPGALVVLPEAIVAPRDLSDVTIFHIEDTFFALRDGQVKKIKNYNMDEELRNMKQEEVKSFLEQDCYVKLSQSNDGEYSLRSHGRGRGGGPVAGKMAYWAVKSFCWAVVGGVVGGGAVATANTVVPMIAAKAGLSAVSTAQALALTKTSIGIATGKMGAGGVAAKLGATYIATSSPAIVAAATETVVATTATVGGGAGLIAFIEGLSLAAGFACGMASGPV